MLNWSPKRSGRRATKPSSDVIYGQVKSCCTSKKIRRQNTLLVARGLEHARALSLVPRPARAFVAPPALTMHHWINVRTCGNHRLRCGNVNASNKTFKPRQPAQTVSLSPTRPSNGSGNMKLAFLLIIILANLSLNSGFNFRVGRQRGGCRTVQTLVSFSF